MADNLLGSLTSMVSGQPWLTADVSQRPQLGVSDDFGEYRIAGSGFAEDPSAAAVTLR
jgi:hypothetical protein